MKVLCKFFTVFALVFLVWPQADEESQKSEEVDEEPPPTTLKRRDFTSTKCRDTYTHKMLVFDVEINSFKVEVDDSRVEVSYRPLLEYTIKKDDNVVAHRKVRPVGWNKFQRGSSGKILDNNNRVQFLRNHQGKEDLIMKTISKVVLGVPGKHRSAREQVNAPVDLCITFDLTKGIKRTTKTTLHSSFRSAETLQSLLKAQ